MKLRNRQSLVTNLPEGQPPKARGMRVTKLLYIGLLTTLAVYLAYVGISHLIYEEQNGQIVLERTHIASVQSGRIASLPVRAGMAVSRGQVLAVIEDAARCDTPTRSPDERSQRLLLDAEFDEARLAGLRSQLAAARQERDRLATRRALEIDAPRPGDVDRAGQEIAQIERDVVVLERRVGLQRAAAKRTLPQGVQAETCAPETVVAPFDGTVAALHQRAHEVVRAGEPIVSLLPAQPSVLVEIYPASREQGRWQQGEQVAVLIPDGHEYAGRIQDVRSAAQPVPERIWDKYSAQGAPLVVRITPVSETTADAWRGLDRMAVTVRLKRVPL